MTADSELLQRFVRDRSEPAFAEFVQRKAGLVFSAALRQVNGDTLLAQDVSQSVFIDVARKAKSLVHHPELTSWLYTSTRYAALNALRERQRRQLREQEAHKMHEDERPDITDEDWNTVRPLLDAALCELPEADRSAVLMRYFENLPFAAMAARLGVGENAARMRSDRALEKLRVSLAGKGLTSTAAVLGVVLSTHAVAAPPSGLAASLTGAALAKTAVTGGGFGALLKVYQAFAMKKISAVITAIVAVLAASITSFEIDDSARQTAFYIYVGCFAIGIVFALLSVIFGHLGHDGDIDFDHGSPGGGGAEAGFGTHDMPGFEPVGPTTIATFVTAFGGIGMALNQNPSLHRLSGFVAAGGAFVIAALVGWGFAAVFRWAQSSSEGRVAELTGLAATVITPIPEGGVGEIAYVQAGTRYSAPARSENGDTFASGAVVKITRVIGTQFYVTSR